MAISFVVLVTLVSCGNEAKKMSQGLIILFDSIYLLLYLLSSCWLPRCPCHVWRHSRLPSHPFRLVVALYSPRRCLVVASPPLSPTIVIIMSTSVAAPTRTVTATAIAIGIIGRYPCQCCCLSFPSFPLFSHLFSLFSLFPSVYVLFVVMGRICVMKLVLLV